MRNPKMPQLDDGPPTFWKVIANFYIPFTVSLHTQFVLVYYFCILFIYFTRSLNFLFNAAGNALGIFFLEFYLKFSSNEELLLAESCARRVLPHTTCCFTPAIATNTTQDLVYVLIISMSCIFLICCGRAVESIGLQLWCF